MDEAKKFPHIHPHYLSRRNNHGTYARSSPDTIAGIPIVIFYSMMMQGTKRLVYNNKTIRIIDRFAVIQDNDKEYVYQMRHSSLEGQELVRKARKELIQLPQLEEEIQSSNFTLTRLDNEQIVSFKREYYETEYSHKDCCIVIPEGYQNDYDW